MRRMTPLTMAAAVSCSSHSGKLGIRRYQQLLARIGHGIDVHGGTPLYPSLLCFELGYQEGLQEGVHHNNVLCDIRLSSTSIERFSQNRDPLSVQLFFAGFLVQAKLHS